MLADGRHRPSIVATGAVCYDRKAVHLVRPRRLAWPRTRPFQGRDRGFESRRGHHLRFRVFHEFWGTCPRQVDAWKSRKNPGFAPLDGNEMEMTHPDGAAPANGSEQSKASAQSDIPRCRSPMGRAKGKDRRNLWHRPSGGGDAFLTAGHVLRAATNRADCQLSLGFLTVTRSWRAYKCKNFEIQ